MDYAGACRESVPLFWFLFVLICVRRERRHYDGDSRLRYSGIRLSSIGIESNPKASLDRNVRREYLQGFNKIVRLPASKKKKKKESN